MALRVWLPLNGTTENFGASNAVVTNTGATVNTSGKIGSCYRFGTAASGMTLPTSCMTGFKNAASISMWINILTWNTSWATYFQAGTGSTPWSNYIFGILRNGSESTICFTIGNGSTASNNNYLTSTISLNTWYHLTCTYETGKCKIYLNGALDHEYTTTIVPDFTKITKITIGRCNNDSSYQTNCLMNDIRIYDHCLSPQEVHDISQGLVLHYKLDGTSNGLLPLGYQQLEYIEGSGSSYLNTGYYFNAETDSFKIEFKGNDTANNGMIFASSGGKYFWFYYYGTSGIRIYADNGSGQQGIPGIASDLNKHLAEYKNKHYYIDGVDKGSLSNTYTDTTGPIWLFSYGGSSYPFKGRIYSVEVRKNNDIVKIYIPAKRLSDSKTGMYELIDNQFFPSNSSTNFIAGDVVYTSSLVADNSGYGNDGSINSYPSFTDDSPRYLTAAYLGTYDTPSIALPLTNFSFLNSCTISWWGKFDTTRTLLLTGQTTSYYVMASNDNTWYQGTAGTGTVYKDGIAGTYKCVNDGWHHWCVTGLNLTPWTAAYINKYSSYWSYNGYISDFRIYATALSADDVLDLYKTSARVNDSGEIFAYELSENSTDADITHSGIFNMQEVNEYLVEPDGSVWEHVFHHVSPTNNLFASTDTFTTGVYKDETKWFNMHVLNDFSTFEFLAIQKPTANDNYSKWRWTQSVNPWNATYAQTTYSNVTFVTGNGYSSPASSYGGLYYNGGGTLFNQNNGVSGNWWGATGSWTAFNGGIPGWNGITVTTGSMDLFIRVTDAQKLAKIYENGNLVSTDCFIEM